MTKKKSLPESMDELLGEVYGHEQDSPDINDTTVQMMRQSIKKLSMLTHTTLEEVQDYEGGRVDPKDFLENMHVDWISLVQQMDRVRMYLEKIGVDLSNTELYIRHWK
jgi:hypothetical protein